MVITSLEQLVCVYVINLNYRNPSIYRLSKGKRKLYLTLLPKLMKLKLPSSRNHQLEAKIREKITEKFQNSGVNFRNNSYNGVLGIEGALNLNMDESFTEKLAKQKNVKKAVLEEHQELLFRDDDQADDNLGRDGRFETNWGKLLNVDSVMRRTRGETGGRRKSMESGKSGVSRTYSTGIFTDTDEGLNEEEEVGEEVTAGLSSFLMKFPLHIHGYADHIQKEAAFQSDMDDWIYRSFEKNLSQIFLKT